MTDPLAAIVEVAMESVGVSLGQRGRYDTIAARLRDAGVTLQPPAPADGLDVKRLADAFTWFHVRTTGMCGASHLDDAREYAKEPSDD